MTLLSITHLFAHTGDKEILKDLSLDIETGKIHTIMGPNGSGKSTLSQVIMGNPQYEVSEGKILFEKKNIIELTPDERAKLGIFLAFQYPREIAGVTYIEFLRASYIAIQKAKNPEFKSPSPLEFKKFLRSKLEILHMKPEVLDRNVNQGFSGGEKKKAEMLQLLVLEPKLAILDETDSGLDVDALKIVCETLKTIKKEHPEMSILLITHYQRILDYLTPDFIHVMVDGKIVESGNKDLAQKLEKEGYEKYGKKEKSGGLKIVG